MSLALSIYHRLPAWSRSTVASLRGLYLSRWRYDSRSEDLVAEILERDRWSAAQWESWRERRLETILYRAATRVPYYRREWAGGNGAPMELANWPVLEKASVRSESAAFVADDRPLRSLFRDHTSGTTGAALDIWSSAETVRLWYAMFEARSRRWYGVSRRDRWAIVGGQLVVPVARRRPPFWVRNAPLRQLYMSAYHLAPDLVPHYLDALAKFGPTHIVGYPSALHALALGALRAKRRDVRLAVAITNAEPVYGYQREAIEEAFGCPVRETYGMAEMCAAAGECERGRLHEWPDAGWIERAPAGETVDLVTTGLVNADMPLVRYRVGDRVEFSDETCDCGRTLPVFGRIEGRADDVLYTRDGRAVGRLDPVFKLGLPVREAQIEQVSLGRVVVRVVPDDTFDERSARTLRNAVRERIGDIEVDIELTSAIPRTPSGKFRAVINSLPEEETALLDR